MTRPTTTQRPLDGRQTAGRKGVPYDWQSLLDEGDVAEKADPVLTSSAMPALIGLLLT
jgi:hypothetical protein